MSKLYFDFRLHSEYMYNVIYQDCLHKAKKTMNLRKCFKYISKNVFFFSDLLLIPWTSNRIFGFMESLMVFNLRTYSATGLMDFDAVTGNNC